MENSVRDFPENTPLYTTEELLNETFAELNVVEEERVWVVGVLSKEKNLLCRLLGRDVPPIAMDITLTSADYRATVRTQRTKHEKTKKNEKAIQI